MTKIRAAFEKGKAFIPFITCGDPDLETTAAVVREAVRNGADLVELGIPFSDPTAEGPVIQGANIRALAGGMTTDRAFALVENLRQDVTIPLVFMTYANVVFSYGADAFFANCAKVGIDGIILPDLPFEEKDEFQSVSRKYGVDLISLIAPTSHQRIAMIAREAEGVERHAMSKKGPETKKAEKSRENIKKAQFYVEFHAKPGDKLQKGA